LLYLTAVSVERCQREQDEISARTDAVPLWLRLMGWADWEIERELIQEQLSASQAARAHQRADLLA